MRHGAAFKRGTYRAIFIGFVAVVLTYTGWVALWARQGESLQKVSLGRDSCAHCGMVVSDQRYAVSLLTRDKQNHNVTAHFDDIGCFLKYARKHKVSEPQGVAYDRVSGKAIALREARFEKDEKIMTPMGTGWVAGTGSGSGLSLEQAIEH